MTSHTHLWLVVAFVGGAVLYQLVLGWSAVYRRQRFPSLGAYFGYYAIPIVARLVLQALTFYLANLNPTILHGALSAVGLDEVHDLNGAGALAALTGFFADGLSGQLVALVGKRAPWLLKLLPESPAGEPDEGNAGGDAKSKGASA